MKNDGGPAYPQPIDDSGTLTAKTEGMALRDWFAGMALSGLLSNTLITASINSLTKNDVNKALEGFADWAYQQSDAMLKEREK